MRKAPSSAFFAAAVAALIAMSAIAGCGGSDEPESLKKPQFVEQANSICENSESDRNEAMQDAADGEAGGAESATEAALPSIQEMIEELSDLGPPAGDEQEVQAIIAAFEDGAKKLEAGPAELASTVGAFERADQLAEEYGLTACAI